MKKISVIIPVYNAEKYLGETLDCITRQTYKNLEIICVLDAPTDNSEKIAKKFQKADPRIKILRNEKNMDLPATRNNGAGAARGEYIHFMDADDVISPDFYEIMLAGAEKENSDVAACGVLYEKKPWRSIWFKKAEAADGRDKFKKTRVLSRGWAWRYLIRRSFWNRHKLHFPNLVPMEDKPAMVKMIYYANSVALCPAAVYFYKHRVNSILTGASADKIRRRHDNRVAARKLVRDFVREHKI